MDKDVRTALRELHQICAEGNAKTLQKFLSQQKQDINLVSRRLGRDRKSSLHICAEHGNNDCLVILLARDDVTVDVEDARKWSPLQVAVDAGHVSVVETLLRNGSDVTRTTEMGATVCHIAARRGHDDVLKMLLKAGPELVDVCNKNDWTALHVSSAEGHARAAQVLIEHSADVNRKTCLGETVCSLAARADSLRIVKLLRKNGADVNACNQNGETALHAAAMQGHCDVIAYLLSYGADVRAHTKSGLTALHFAAKLGFDEVIMTIAQSVQRLSEVINVKTDVINTVWVATMGCGLNLPEVTPLHFAAIEAKPEAVATLLKLGADADVTDGKGATALDLLRAHMQKYQIWDRESANETERILSNWRKDEAAALEWQACAFSLYDSDYQSSCSAQDLADCLADLEINVRSFPVRETPAKQARSALERLKRKSRLLGEVVKNSHAAEGKEKATLTNDLKHLEEELQQLTRILQANRATSVTSQAAVAAAEVRRSSCSDGSSASGGDSQDDVNKLLRSFR